MEPEKFITSACRYCRHYETQGRRGGMCQRLNVPVQGHWTACTLAVPPFSSNWHTLRELVHLESSFSITCTTTSAARDAAETATPPAAQPVFAYAKQRS
ncbi:MAG: hypothetical protein HC890_10570 [Chloroflexaceae bacterium]|nr:hypothetical protein [Chloroflexaceae bacterium]